MNYLSLVFFVSLVIHNVYSYNILMLTPMGSRSHKIFYMGIANALLDKGHQVTIVSGDANSKPIKNLKDVVITTTDTASTFLGNVFEKGGADGVVKNMIFGCAEMCVAGLESKVVQDLKKDKYDVVMLSLFFDYCYLSLVDHMKVPHIYMFSGGIFGPFYKMTGQVSLPSVVGSTLLESKFPMTFVQRLQTVLVDTGLAGVMNYYIYPSMMNLCKERGVCRQDMPSFHEFNKNVSLTIINEIRTLENPPRPMMQNMIYAGGAHIKPGKPLSKDLEKWASGSGEAGFIYFSLGSAVNPSDMPEKYKQIIIKVFGSLKQRILWKWNEGNMDNLPPNVRVEKWLPQPDILAHPKIRLFITHGGLLSTMEATYHGVPLLGMPLYADQFDNMNQAALLGNAKVFYWKNLSEEAFRNIINEAVNDENLVKSSKMRSTLMKDSPTDPAEDAAFWVEYVVRNKGAPHLRSPIHQLSWIELNNLDVYAAFFSFLMIFFYVVYKTFKFVICFCFRSKNTSKKTKKNKKD